MVQPEFENSNPLLPTRDRIIVHIQSEGECVTKEYDEALDDYLVGVEVVSVDADGGEGKFHVHFRCPPGTAEEKFAVGQRYNIELSVD